MMFFMCVCVVWFIVCDMFDMGVCGLCGLVREINLMCVCL